MEMPFNQQATEILDQLLSVSPDLIFVQDLIGRFTYVNATSARTFGIERNQFLGKLLQDLDLPPAIVQLLNHQRELVSTQCRSISGEMTIPTICQIQRHYEYIYSPIQDSDGKLIQVVFTARDITERKQAETALRESEEKYRSLFDAASDSILITDFATGRLLNANWSAARQLGYSRSELLERCMKDIEDVEDTQSQQRILRKLEIEGNAVFESIFRRKNGTRFPVEINAQVIEYEDQLVVQHFIRDITDRKQTEAEIRALNSDLEQRVLQRTTELSLANQELAAEIVERQRTEAALRMQQQQERLVSSIAQQVHQSLDLAEVLNTSVTEIRQFLQTDRVFIYRFDSNWSGDVIVESVAAEQKPILGQDLGCPGFGNEVIQVYRQGQITQIEDIYDANLPTSFVEFLASLQVRANLIVPIVQGKQLWGLLIAHHCKAPRQWQAIEIELLKQLAVQIGIAIQQAELYQNLQIELRERKRAEAELRQSEQKLYRSRELFRTVIDSQTELICRFLPNGTLTFVNDAYCRYLNQSRSDLIGRNILEFISPPEQERIKKYLASFSLEQPVGTSEHPVITANGEVRWQQWNDRAFFDANGQIVEFQGVGRDISARKRAEIALRESEAMNRILVDANPNLVIRMKRDGTYLDFIPAKDFKVIQPYAEMRGRHIAEVMPPEVAQQRMYYVHLALETGATQTYEFEVVIEGQTYYQEAQIAVSGTDEVVVIVRDMSNRKRREIAPQQTQGIPYLL